MVLGFSGIYTLFINSILHVIIDRAPFQMQPCDFRIWNGDYINGNTTMILFLICILLAAAFTVGGNYYYCKKTECGIIEQDRKGTEMKWERKEM